MFSTPSIRIHNQENADSVMRKPLLNSTRKAFQDRSVNGVNKVNQLLKNTPHTPINKQKLNFLQVVQTPEVKLQPQENEPPTWMTSMSLRSPRNDMNMIEFSSKLFKANMYSRPVTPPPEPIGDFESYFGSDFELLHLPPTPGLTFADIELPTPKSPCNFFMDDDFEFLLAKPHTNFDY